MPERIIGQCNTADFKTIEHLVDMYGTGDPSPDTFKLKKKQILALALVSGLHAIGLSFEHCYRIRVVLFWENHVEFRFFPGSESQELKKRLGSPLASKLIQDRMAEILGKRTKKGGEHEDNPKRLCNHG